MWWNFIGRLFIGFYELLLAILILKQSAFKNILGIDYPLFLCHQTKHLENCAKMDPQGIGVGFVTLQNVLVIMSTKFSHIVFFTIPYKMNRIKKTESEIEAEQAAKAKKTQVRKESIKNS